MVVAAELISVRCAADETSSLLTFQKATQLLQAYCCDCHAEGSAEGEFGLEQISSPESLGSQFERWQKIRQRINDRSMPPADSEPLDDAERVALLGWIDQASIAAVCSQGPIAGPPLLRRLARHEYSNTIRDLLNIHFDAGQGLPEDAAGGEGFTNAAETLIISPIHAEKYLQAASDALDYASRDATARERLLSARPGDAPQAEEKAARENLKLLANRAFRRPVESRELARYVALFQAARKDELDFDEAVLYAMRGILISPSFLFISETPPARVGVAEPLGEHELAVRLSYFLWASTPDDELRRAADAGILSTPEELERQTQRMLKARGTHLQDSLEQFVGSWLGTADLGRAKQVDRVRHPHVEDPHVAALRNQPVYALVSILQKNESLLSLIDAPWTFLNNELVRVYGMRKSQIKGDFVQNLKRVELPEEYRYRGGLLGMGGVLAVSSYPGRSSPVLRGAWVLEKMLGVELPPPPPNIPSLDDSPEEVEASTLRERLERHRQDAACATCHDRIDPLGFALENFDEIGVWRERDSGGPIDAVAKLPGGREIEGVAGLKEYLTEQRDVFARVITRKMLGYALGRSLQATDLCTVELILQRLQANGYRAQELVLGIVTSEPFCKKILIQGDVE